MPIFGGELAVSFSEAKLKFELLSMALGGRTKMEQATRYMNVYEIVE